MQQDILSRYERTPEGHFVIDVAISRVEELYNNFDRRAPYIRRDLDADFTDYLMDCATELEARPFIIRFTLPELPDSERQSRIRRSVNAYFLYLTETNRKQLREMFRRAGLLGLMGLGILFACVSARQLLRNSHTVLTEVVTEGLTIAAWVALWESVAVLLIQWPPHRRRIRLAQRIAAAEITFQLDCGTARPANGS